MTHYTGYWMATLMRGVIALVAAIVIVILTDLGATILLLPLAIVSALLALAAYVIIDSAVVLATSFMLPHHRAGRIALRVQGVCGVAIGILCFVFASGEVDLTWFLYLGAAQALSLAIAELCVARDTSEYHNSMWCYASAGIAAVSSMMLLIRRHATGRGLAWSFYSYLGIFGLNCFVLAAHMLFEVAHAARHPRS